MEYYDNFLQYKFGSIKLRQQRCPESNITIPIVKSSQDEVLDIIPEINSRTDDEYKILYTFYLSYCYIVLNQIIDILNIDSDDIYTRQNKLYDIKY